MLANYSLQVCINRPQLTPDDCIVIACEGIGLDPKKIPRRTSALVKKRIVECRYGSKSEIYMTAVPRLERIIDHDPDTVIVLNLYPDEVMKYQCDGKPGKGATLSASDKKLVYASRIHSITIIPGSAVRQCRAAAANSVQLRVVHTTDFCHCYGSERGALGHISGIGPDGEFHIDAVVKTSENENQNSCSQLYEARVVACGPMTSAEVVVGDRLKGQAATLAYWLSLARKDHCVFHLYENLKNHGADDEVLALFQDLVYEKEPGEFGYEFTLDDILREASDTTRAYLENSILSGDCDPTRFCDSHILGERENVRTDQPSESWHAHIGGSGSIRALQLPLCIEAVYIRDVQALFDNRQKYIELCQHGAYLPSRYSLEFNSRSVDYRTYTIISSTDTRGIVQAKYGEGNFRKHEIDISTGVARCTNFHCEQLDGVMCVQAVEFLQSKNCHHLDYVDRKYTVAMGIQFYATSLRGVRENMRAVLVSDLPRSKCRVVGPHIPTPRGRPKSRRMRKNQRLKSRISRRYLAQCRNDVLNGAPEPPLPQELLGCEAKHCSTCGRRGHNASTCSGASNGRGELMSSQTQKDILKDPYLAVVVKRSGETILPKSLKHFHRMQKKPSRYKQMSFAAVLAQENNIDVNFLSDPFANEDESSVSGDSSSESELGEDEVHGSNGDDDIEFSFQHEDTIHDVSPEVDEGDDLDALIHDLQASPLLQESAVITQEVESSTVPLPVRRGLSFTPKKSSDTLSSDVPHVAPTPRACRSLSMKKVTNSDDTEFEPDPSIPLYELRSTTGCHWSLLCEHCKSGQVRHVDDDGIIRGFRPAKTVTDLKLRKPTGPNEPSYVQLRDDPSCYLDTESVDSMCSLIAHQGCINGERMDSGTIVASAVSYQADAAPRAVSLDTDVVHRIVGVAYSSLHYTAYEILLRYHIIILYDGLAMNVRQWKLALAYMLKKYEIDSYPIFTHIEIPRNMSQIPAPAVRPNQWFLMTAASFNSMLEDISLGGGRTRLFLKALPNSLYLSTRTPHDHQW